LLLLLFQYYNEAMELCHQVYGEESLLSSRLYINIGIVYEDNNDYVKAFEYFRKWAETSEAVLGSDHPKTIRAKGVLREPRYRLVALRLKQLCEPNNPDNHVDSDSIDEARINQEVGDLDEEEDGYQNRSEDRQDDDDENIEQRENVDEFSNIQQLINATNIMQGIFNDIWHHLNIDDVHNDDDDIRVDVQQSINNNQDALTTEGTVNNQDALTTEGTVNNQDALTTEGTVNNQDAPDTQELISDARVEPSNVSAVVDNQLRDSAGVPDNEALNEYGTDDGHFITDPLDDIIAEIIMSSLTTRGSESQTDSNRIDDNNDNGDAVSPGSDAGSSDATNLISGDSSEVASDHNNDNIILAPAFSDANRTLAAVEDDVDRTIDETVAEQGIYEDNRNF